MFIFLDEPLEGKEKVMKKLFYSLMVLCMALGFTISVKAQAPGNQDANSRGRQGGSQNHPMMMNPDQMQQMMAQRLKEMLELNDEEWSVIGPKVMKVFELSMQNRGNPGMMFMGRRGMQPGGGPGMTQGDSSRRRGRFGGMSESPVETAMNELQTLLQKKDASVDDIKAQVIKIRRAKDKVQQEKASAQKELRELLTVKQEATLIAMGVLD